MKMEGGLEVRLPGALPREAVIEFDTLVRKVAVQGNRWAILEHFKRYFAGAYGSTSNRSSSESWAESDLNNLIWQAADNAPLFIEAFMKAARRYAATTFTLPEVGLINRILADH